MIGRWNKLVEPVSNQNGSIGVMALIMIPTIIILILSISGVYWITHEQENNLEAALKNSVKAACAQVDPESQAHGTPRIAYNRAVDTVVYFMNDNLVSGENLPGDKHPIFEELEYWIVVYNGDKEYPGDDDFKLHSYYFTTNGTDEGTWYEEFSDDKKPELVVKVTDHGFEPEAYTGPAKTVRLTEPSIIVMVKTKMKPIFGGEPWEVSRWMSAKIHLNE